MNDIKNLEPNNLPQFKAGYQPQKEVILSGEIVKIKHSNKNGQSLNYAIFVTNLVTGQPFYLSFDNKEFDLKLNELVKIQGIVAPKSYLDKETNETRTSYQMYKVKVLDRKTYQTEVIDFTKPKTLNEIEPE